MSEYRLFFRKSAEKDFQRLDSSIKKRISETISKLSNNPRPHGAIKLTGSDRIYRLRIADYRVLYQIDDIVMIVSIERIRHRKDAYRKD